VKHATTPALDLIAELPREARKELRRVAQHLVLPAGKVLFEKGDHGRALIW